MPDPKTASVDEFDQCPECGTEWAYEVEGKKYSHLIGIEDPRVYDGVSWWKCPACGTLWDRWTGLKVVASGKDLNGGVA